MTASDAAVNWCPLDSVNNTSLVLRAKALGTVPFGFGGYQYPKSGNNFIVTSFFCASSTCPSSTRWYPRNRLKQNLEPNKVYCAKYHVVNTNNCVVAIDSYGLYAGGYMLDTIKYCSIPITYLNPQIQYQNGIITDTLNWVPITGTFVAAGSEKYIVLGNFKSNAFTQTVIINPTYLPALGSDILIDDVSLIERDLPAYAGPDQYVYLEIAFFWADSRILELMKPVCGFNYQQ